MQKVITKEMEDEFIKDAEAALQADRSETKIRITTMIDGDVKDALIARAKEEGHGKYQATLNSILRKELLEERAIPVIEINESHISKMVDSRMLEILKQFEKNRDESEFKVEDYLEDIENYLKDESKVIG